MRVNVKQSHVKVVLRGGIGNQLFQYFAGLDLANQCNLKLMLEDSLVQDRKNGLRSIHSLRIQADFVQDCISTNRLRLQRITDAAQLRSVFVNAYLAPITKRVIINEVGFDSRVYEYKFGQSLVGYFQTWKHVENCPLTAREDLVADFLESTRVKGLLSISGSKRVIGIHIRRGDYVALKNRFGIIGNSYYAMALKELDFNSGLDEIWIFTDGSIDEVHETLDLKNIQYRIFNSKSGLSDLEQLALMAQLKHLIIANSSFSWWAGALTSPDSIVIAPLKWYRSMPDPNCLIPSRWIQIENEWEV